MGISTTYISSSGALPLALVLGLLAGSLVIGPIESAPVRREVGSNANDPVWRMVAGAKTASKYVFYKQQVVAFEEEPLVSVNKSNSSSELEHLESVLEGVCELLSIYDLISRVDTRGSDLYLLFTQNIVDSCIWLNHLVSNTSSVIASDQFHLLNDTCTPESSMPRLRHYCVQMKVREPDQLIHLMQRTINDGLSAYYPTPVVDDDDECQWLENSPAITGGFRDRVENETNLHCYH